MAIAPLLDGESGGWSEDLYGAVWPRPSLQLVADPCEVEAPDSSDPAGGPEPPEEEAPAAARVITGPRWVDPQEVECIQVRTGADVARRRARRATVRRRRRGIALATVVAGLVCSLALPASLPGGSSPAPRASGPLAGETIYVVQPGDTLWSIASRFDHGGDPRPLAEALARETGSADVVPGEHIGIP